MATSTPTKQIYAELVKAYDHFNKILFENKLPSCLITVQRTNNAYGFFSADRWQGVKGTTTDEIALNPQHFNSRSTEEVLGTLVHEMVHLWQHHFGKPGRTSYHNKQWAQKMKLVGLTPSDTGKPGGKETGQHMTHYIPVDSIFKKTCLKLIKQGFKITWSERGFFVEGKTNKKNKEKYTCPSCGINAWAKYELKLICGTCSKEMWAKSDLAHPGAMLD